MKKEDCASGGCCWCDGGEVIHREFVVTGIDLIPHIEGVTHKAHFCKANGAPVVRSIDASGTLVGRKDLIDGLSMREMSISYDDAPLVIFKKGPLNGKT